MKFLILSAIFFVSLFTRTGAQSQYNFNVIRTLKEINHLILKSSYSSDGNYIITTGEDNSIIIWDYQSNIIKKTIAGIKRKTNAFYFSEEKGIFFYGGEDNIVTAIDISNMDTINVFEGHRDVIKAIDVSPDGKYLATGSGDKTIRVWDINSKKLIYELTGHKKDVNTVRFNPDGEVLVSGGADKQLIMWSMLHGDNFLSTEAHNGIIRDVIFSPDGNTIASCGDDKLIKTWSVEGLYNIKTFAGHDKWVQTIDFSPDGKNLLSGGHDQRIILWDVLTGEALVTSEKQNHIVLNVDINPYHPVFISSIMFEEGLKIWALSGLDYSQWEAPGDSQPLELEQQVSNDQVLKINELVDSDLDISEDVSEDYSPIEILFPDPSGGDVVHDKSFIYILGRISDPDGINTFLINRDIVGLSSGGAFEYRLNLLKGDNVIEFVSINNNGKMSKEYMLIDCTDPLASLVANDRPDIENGEYHALLIGINDYQDIEISDLDNPVKDAESLYNILVSDYFFPEGNAILLKNPTRKEIIITLDELGNRLSENDNLLIFFAGHGYWDSKGEVGYWLPSDAQKANSTNWFRNSTLRDFIGSIHTRHTILIADACFSGAIFKTRAAFGSSASEGINKLYEMPSRKAITSGIMEEVPDESQFIKYLIRRLETNTEKFLPAEILFGNLKAVLINNSPLIPNYGTIQNVGDEGGDFIFIKKE